MLYWTPEDLGTHHDIQRQAIHVTNDITLKGSK